MQIPNTRLKKITQLLLKIKECIQNKNPFLPLMKSTRQFNFEHLLNLPLSSTPICLSKKTLNLLLRIVQILTISIQLISQNRFITKRNLYYQLIKYYPNYSLIDDDILIITDTLKFQRHYLNILSSNKLLMFYYQNQKDKNKQMKIKLCFNKFNMQCQSQSTKQNNTIIQNQTYQLKPNHIFKTPNCPKINLQIQTNKQPHLLNHKLNLLIIQKQSIFQILCQSLNIKNSKASQNWLLLTSKGYPDFLTLQFINQIKQKFNHQHQHQDLQIYYLGDNDIYGIDIMLTYSIGNQKYKGLIPKMKWLCKFNQLVDHKRSFLKLRKNNSTFQQNQYLKLLNQDIKKAQQLLNRKYFQQNLYSSSQQSYEFLMKLMQWKQIIQNIIKNGLACELQSYFKLFNQPFELIQFMIEQKLHI